MGENHFISEKWVKIVSEGFIIELQGPLPPSSSLTQSLLIHLTPWDGLWIVCD